MRRHFSTDATTGIQKFWEYDEATDTAVIHTQQDVTALCEHNEEAFKAAEGSKWGEWTRVASIPNTIYYQLLMSGKLHDAKYMKQFLNSSEFRKFRTRPGKVSGVVGG